jgi:hypothetical protein
MKKIIMISAMGIFALGAEAEDTVLIDDSSMENASGTFNGVYFALGLGGSFLKNEADYESPFISPSTGSFEKQNVSRFIGTAAFGGGKAFKDRFYLGAEASIDFMQSKTSDAKIGGVKICDINNRGVTPALAIRLGFTHGNSLVYFKPAVQFPAVTFKQDGDEFGKINKPTWSVALGYEHSFCKKFSARLEGEWVFKTKEELRPDAVEKITAKVNGGFNVRALIAYGIKY